MEILIAKTEQLADQNRRALLPQDARKETAYVFRKLVNWLNSRGYHWLLLNLVEYQEYLQQEDLSDRSIKLHISMIRSWYRKLLADREIFVELANGQLPDGQSIDEAMSNIRTAIDAVSTATLADRELKVEFRILADWRRTNLIRRIQRGHAFEPLGLIKLRDAALAELMLETGPRESEVIRLKVADLYHKIGELPALRIEQVRGNEIRLAPYLGGEIPYAVERWIKEAGLRQGDWLFRTFYQGGTTLRPSNMRLAAVRQILKRYHVEFEPRKRSVVTSTDIRATYAWHMHWGKEHSVEAIAQYLGASVALVERFVGVVQNGSDDHA